MVVAIGGTGQTDQRSGQLVLNFCGVGLLAAYACLTGTTLATGSLFTLKTNIVLRPLLDDSPIGADGYDMKGNVLAAVFDSGFDSKAEASAAGDGHPGNGDGTDIVIPEDQR